MKTESVTTDLVPPDLIAEIQAIAEEEHRAPGELMRDAFERYKADRDWKKIFAYGEARAKALGLTEEDVPRLIAEYRREQRQKQQGRE
jgi:hypothetical protein